MDRVADFYQHEVQAKPGVDKFLSLLKMEGVWMYVATATDRPLAEVEKGGHRQNQSVGCYWHRLFSLLYGNQRPPRPNS